jgi:hypothetical protein
MSRRNIKVDWGGIHHLFLVKEKKENREKGGLKRVKKS